MKTQLEESQTSKDVLLLEVAAKTKQNMDILEEKKQVLRDLAEEREKVWQHFLSF